MTKTCSIAEARNNLASLVHEVENQSPIQLTRRGVPVAVLVSMQEYQRLVSTGFWDAYIAFRQQAGLAELDIEADIFEGVRDRSPGREAQW